jgi:hypothetical protein
MLQEEVWNGGEKIKKRQKLPITAFSKLTCEQGVAVTGHCSLCQLREGTQHRQRDINLIEKCCSEKTVGMMGENKKETKKSPSPTSQSDLRVGDDSDVLLFALLTEGRKQAIKKSCGEKALGMEGGIKKRPKLTVTTFAKSLVSGG